MGVKYYETTNGTKFIVEARNSVQEKVHNLLFYGEYKTDKQLKNTESKRRKGHK